MKRRQVAPIVDSLTAADFLTRNPPAHLSLRLLYRCGRCGYRVEAHLQAEAVACIRCGTRMRPAL